MLVAMVLPVGVQAVASHRAKSPLQICTSAWAAVVPTIVPKMAIRIAVVLPPIDAPSKVKSQIIYNYMAQYGCGQLAP